MSKLLITTQVYENYGAHSWGGPATGPCPQYWKAKGGNDYVVKNIDINRASDIANWACGQIKCDNEAFREYVIGWEVVEDDYLTEFERDQMRYEGLIRFPAQELTVEA